MKMVKKKNKIGIVVSSKPNFLIPRSFIKEVIKSCFEFADYTEGYSVTIIVVDSAFIKEINALYRGKSKETTVLSFPLFLDKHFIAGKGYNNLGDIFLNLNMIKDLSEDFRESLAFNLVHSFLHLLGYSHDNKKKELVMEKIERKLLENIHGTA